MSEHRGDKITIRYDEKICTHSGNCVRGLPAVFDVNRQPWVNPNDSSVEEIKRAVGNCPSGALSFVENG